MNCVSVNIWLILLLYFFWFTFFFHFTSIFSERRTVPTHFVVLFRVYTSTWARVQILLFASFVRFKLNYGCIFVGCLAIIIIISNNTVYTKHVICLCYKLISAHIWQNERTLFISRFPSLSIYRVFACALCL